MRRRPGGRGRRARARARTAQPRAAGPAARTRAAGQRVIPVRDRSTRAPAGRARRRRRDRRRRRVADGDVRAIEAATLRYLRRERAGGAARRATTASRRRATSSSPASTPTAPASPAGSRRLLRALRADPGGARPVRRPASTRRATAARAKPARVIPYGRVPFVPGAALVVAPPPALRRDAARAARTSTSSGACHTSLRADRHVAHDHRTDRALVARRVYYGRTRRRRSRGATPARRARCTSRPGPPRPGPPPAAAPGTALAITATATALLAREPTPHAVRIAGLGTLRSGRSSPTRSRARGGRSPSPRRLTLPRARPAAAALRPSAEPADDPPTALGLWLGCLEHRTLDPLLPGLGWRMTHPDGG